MKKQEITEGNKLIAEFMGGEPIGGVVKNPYSYMFPFKFGHKETWDEGGFQGSGKSSVWETEELQYHSDWNWLIPALNKAYDIIKDTERMSWRTRLFNVLNTFLQRGYDNEGNVTETYNIERAFKHLVLFIKDYEEYKHEQTILKKIKERK